MKTRILLLLALMSLLPVSASAATSDWIEVAPGAKLRALSAGTESDGKALIGLELALDAGVVTYWRIPGETGIPTDLSVSDAGAPRDAEIIWPLPERDTGKGVVDFVYRGDLVLPALVAAPATDALTLDVRMGICSDICVPVMTRFALPGDAKPDSVNALRLRQAMAETPIPFEGDNPPLTDIVLDPQDGAVTLAYDPARIAPDKVFPSIDGTAVVYSAPKIDAAAGTLTFDLLVRKGDTSWQGKPLRLSFATPEGPYDIVLPQESR